MFAALRAIGQEGKAPPGDPRQQTDSQKHFSKWDGEGIENWVAAHLRHIKRHEGAAWTHAEQQAEKCRSSDATLGDASEHEAPPADHTLETPPICFPRHVSSQLCAEYSKTLTALHVTAAARPLHSLLSPSFARSGKESEAEASLGVLSDALPSSVLWGMASHVWHATDHADCPTLRRLAAAAQRQDPSFREVNARLAQQLMPAAIRASGSAELAFVQDAIHRAKKAMNPMHAQSPRKRSRVAEEPLQADDNRRTGKQSGDTALSRGFTQGKEAPAAAPTLPVTLPLRSVSARAQAAASSRSRSRSPPPPPSEPSTATYSKALPHPAVGGAKPHAEHSPTTASSFSFGVRVAGQGSGGRQVRGANRDSQGSNDGSGGGPSGGDNTSSTLSCSQPGPTSTTCFPPADAQHALHVPSSFSAQALRQTTLAAFTANGGAAGNRSQPPPLPYVVSPADSGQISRPTSVKRQSWYNPPSLPGSSKAPPYQYELRGTASGNDSADDGSPSRAVLQAPAVNSGGFVTAGAQLISDIRQGRTMSSAYLSKRSPALGLRRTGFQPPFRDQQQHGSADAQERLRGTAPPSSNSADAGRAGKASASNARIPVATDTHKDDEEGSYPASLLLPDGSVPPILLPLDPKLVSQVAMEILDNGAGAKQVGWDDIAGLQHAKASVEEAIVWPLRRPDLFVGLRDPPRGLLLFGPPGTGKTMIARAIANRAGCTFLNISSSSLMSKWMGDGEKLVRCLFAVATVRQPSVIFIDEIDSLLSMRGEGEVDSVRRVKTEFLVQLDGVATDRDDRVLLIGATNRPDELDEAARRRMEKRLYIPLPDETARRELIERLLRSLGPSGADEADKDTLTEGTRPGETVVHTLTDADLDSLVRSTQGYSGADLKQLCREAAMGPLREMSVGQLSEVSVADLRPIQRRDFKQALKRLKPSVGPAEVGRYEEWNRLFGSFNEQDSGDDGDNDDSEN